MVLSAFKSELLVGEICMPGGMPVASFRSLINSWQVALFGRFQQIEAVVDAVAALYRKKPLAEFTPVLGQGSLTIAVESCG